MSRGWRIALAVGIPVLVVLVAGSALLIAFFSGAVAVPGADDAARREVVARIQTEVAGRLGVEPTDVAVDLGDAPVLPQLAKRELDEVTITVRIPEGPATRLLAEAADVDPEHLSLGETTARISLPVDVGFLRFDIGVGLVPSAERGAIVVTPTEFLVDGNPIAIADLLAIPLLGDLVRPLTEPREFCIADQLPAALGLTDLAVEDGTAIAVIEGRGVVLDEEELTSTGSCP